MKQFAALSQSERQEVFQEAATRLGVVPAIVEKDFWVTWVLSQIFGDPLLSKQLMFRGGTSLSKVYGTIERFSEDIDIILDWQQLTDSDPNEPLTKTQDGKLVFSTSSTVTVLYRFIIRTYSKMRMPTQVR